MTTQETEGPTYLIAAYTVRPSGFDDVSHPDKEKWCVTVANAGDGWAIRRGKMCLNYRNEWEYEPPRGSRDDAFLRRCRFNEHAALLRSRRIIDDLDLQGQTFREFTEQVRTDVLEDALSELEARHEHLVNTKLPRTQQRQSHR